MSQTLTPVATIGVPTWGYVGLSLPLALRTNDGDTSYAYGNDAGQLVRLQLQPGDMPNDLSVVVSGNYRFSGSHGVPIGADSQLAIALYADGTIQQTKILDLPDTANYLPFSAAFSVAECASINNVNLLAIELELLNFANLGVVGTGTEGRLRLTNLQADIGDGSLFYTSLNSLLRQEIANALSIPVVFQNEPAPVNGQFAAVQIAIYNDAPVQLVSGHRASGLLKVFLYTPIGTGDRSPLQIADALKAALRVKHFDNIWTQVPYIMSRGRAGSSWLHEIVVPFLANALV